MPQIANPYTPLGGALEGTLPNPSLSSEAILAIQALARTPSSEAATSSGSGGSGSSVIVTGLTTTAMTGGAGTFGYLSAANTLSPTDSATFAKATPYGCYEGTSGSMTIAGVISDAKFTTAGGAPTVGARVFLAAASDDGGASAGKLTATAPTATGSVLTVIGICQDASNYAGAKTAVVLLQFEPSIQL